MKTVSIVALLLLALFCGGCSLYGIFGLYVIFILWLDAGAGIGRLMRELFWLVPLILLGFAVAGVSIRRIKDIHKRL